MQTFLQDVASSKHGRKCGGPTLREVFYDNLTVLVEPKNDSYPDLLVAALVALAALRRRGTGL